MSNGSTKTSRAGRKLDRSRDGTILEAALAVLGEQGYDGTTIDLVAARAGASRATVYRRWPTKVDLVLAAIARLSAADAPAEQLPDTGALRDDMAAMTLSLDDEEQQLRIRALGALVSVAQTEPRLAEAATSAGLGPWIDLNCRLMRRAVDRGEFPPADIDTLAQVIPMMCVARAVQHQPITAEFSLNLIDHVIIPALRGTGKDLP